MLWGLGMVFSYDCIRVVRRICPHTKWTSAVEDILFWLLWAMLLYSLLYRYDYGAVRSYTLAGMSAGIVLYSVFFSRLFVTWVSKGLNKVLRWLFRPFQWFFGKILKVLATILKKIKKNVKSFSKLLKNLLKPVTIKQTGREKRKSGD